MYLMEYIEWLGSKAEIWIALGTWALAIFAFSQVGESRKSAKRQLRAYISVRPFGVENFGCAKIIAIHCATYNHGLTPAFKINHKFLIDVLVEPLPQGVPFPDPTREVTKNTALFPRSEMTSWFRNDRVLTWREVRAICQNKMRLHIWGETTYRDIYGDKWTTQFNASVGGPPFFWALQNAKRKKEGPSYLWEYGDSHGQAT